MTTFKKIVDAICKHPNVQGKPKMIVFDCCRDADPQHARMLNTPAETCVVFSSKLGAGSWITEDKGCVFTDALAGMLQQKARTHDVDSIFMDLRRAMAESSDATVANQMPPTTSNLSCRVLLA